MLAPKTALALWLAAIMPAAASPTLRILHFFGTPPADGTYPDADLVADAAGDLIGVTQQGGPNYGGTIFSLAPDGTYKIVFAFSDGNDGATPLDRVTLDASGNIYGTTVNGGAHHFGVAFRIDGAGHETVLHAFTGGSDGGYPQSAPILDDAGNLYGATSQSSAAGTVYRIAASGAFTVLHEFTGPDGAAPLCRLLRDATGNLFGTTATGGALGQGTVFRLAPDGTLTTLISATSLLEDNQPRAGLIRDAAGNLYGTGSGSYVDGGALFKIIP